MDKYGAQIFEGTNIINKLRQTCIELKNSLNEDQVKSFLDHSIKYLQKDLPFDVVNEIFATILFCFKQNRNLLPNFLDNFLQKIKTNSNYLILASFILSDVVCTESQLTLPGYETFVEESLSSIFEQIQKNEKPEFFLFDHKISNQFKNELIINLLLSSKLTEETFLNFFPYLFTQHILSKYPKFDIILDNVSKSGIIRISTQTEASNLDIYDFIKSQGQCDIKPFSKEAITLIESAAIYIKSPSKKIIKGLKKEKILQFLAVIIVIIKNYKMQEKVKFSASNLLELFIEGTKCVNNSDNKVFIESIDLIVSNYFYINSTLSIPMETIFEIFIYLLKLIKFDVFHGNKTTLFYSIFDLFDKVKYFNFRQPICDFFKEQENLIITQIIRHVEEINKDYRFANNKFDLKYFDQSVIFSTENDDSQKVIQIIYFLLNSCTNYTKEKLKLVVDDINYLLYQCAFFGKWKEVLLVGQFLQKIGLSNKLDSLRTNDQLPLNIKIQLFGIPSNELSSVNELIKIILNDPAPEEHDILFSTLFDMLTKNDSLLSYYLTLLLTKYEEESSYQIPAFYRIFEKLLGKYKHSMIEVCNKMFDYWPGVIKLLIFKIKFVIDENIQLPIIDSILSTLYKELEVNNCCYQAYYCLMNLASSFPAIFASDPKKVFVLAYPAIEYLSYIFEKKEDEKHMSAIKSGYSALIFLTSALQSATVIDVFFKWIFTYIEKLSNTQVLFSFVILNMLNENIAIKCVVQGYINKYNFLNTISKLLKRKVPEGYFATFYKNNIYKYLTDTYQCCLHYNMYIYAQTDELMKLNHPIAYLLNSIYMNYQHTDKQKMFIDVSTPQLTRYIRNVLKEREFWLSYPFDKSIPEYIDENALEAFLSNLERKETSEYHVINIPEVQRPITMKMARYVTKQKNWVYKYILYGVYIQLNNQMRKHLSVIIQRLNILKNEKPNSDDDNIDPDYFKLSDFYKSLYCQDSLIKNLIDELFLPTISSRCVSTLSDLFYAYSFNNSALLSLLSIISNTFTEVYQKCTGYASPLYLKGMYDLIEILSKMTSINGFKENFFEKCGNNLINIVLSPELRCDPMLMWSLCKLLDNFTNLPIMATQVIGFTFLIGNEKVLSAGISLCSKFSNHELGYIDTLTLNLFDDELKNKKRQSIIVTLINFSPIILEKRKNKIFSVLKGLLKKFLVQNNEKIIESIGIIMTKLAPKRDDFDDFDIPNEILTEVPLHIKKRDPSFWNLFEKYMEPILKLVNNDSNYLAKFSFLFSYPEFISFKNRSMVIRKKLKDMIDQNGETVLNVSSMRILETSFESMRFVNQNDLKKKLYVIFDRNRKTVDMGGPTREWMSKLAKEIFNTKYGLFDCSSKMTYQPSDVSNIQPLYLEHFRYAGIFVARALMEGQCIDAHLTTSFIKQILHQKLALKDLEYVDEQLFNSLTWLLDNDVDSLDMYFEIDSEKLGVHETIPLKENGSKIKVTNENKAEFVELNFKYVLRTKIEKQIDAFCEGFNFLIPHYKICCFTPKEFDLLVCGVTDFDVEDFIENTVFEYPYTADHPAIQMFFNVIRSWDNEKLSKLLSFMTGSQRIPANGFKEFVEITGFPLKIAAGGDENSLPQTHTCFNTMDLPSYSNEEELKNKLLLAIQECDSFGLI